MSIFDKIRAAIFGDSHETRELSPAEVGTPVSASTTTPMATTPVFVPDTADTPVVAETRVERPHAAPVSEVDVAAMLDEAVTKNGQRLDWRRSVVDLMKALGLEASLAERKELAEELGYPGDMHDSAAMNIWLHKALLQRLADNGGQVPAELLD